MSFWIMINQKSFGNPFLTVHCSEEIKLIFAVDFKVLVLSWPAFVLEIELQIVTCTENEGNKLFTSLKTKDPQDVKSLLLILNLGWISMSK